MFSRCRALVIASILMPAAIAVASGPSFHPDVVLTGSSLKGWNTLGDANWTASNGEVEGTPTAGKGGWLVLGRSLQDVNFYADFRCTGGCETGVLLRAEKMPDGGMQGIYVSLSDPTIPEFAVTIDATGQIVNRQRLARGGGLMRVAPPPRPEQSGRGGNRNFRRSRPTVELPVQRPDTNLRPGDWNSVEIFLDANILRAFLNNGHEFGGVTDSTDGYGPVALYVGGSGKAEFKTVAVGDMGLKLREPHKVGAEFSRQQISDFYYSWGVSAADFNRDGHMDIVSGPYIYYGPDYRTSREIWLAHAFSPTDEFDNTPMEFAADFTGDGWPDVITAMFGGFGGGEVDLYVNPQGAARRWKKYKVVTGLQSEVAVLRDLNGDGVPTLVYCGDGYVRYAQPDRKNPTGPWIVHNVSERGYANGHGIGVGDINGDGRLDIINAYGWWEHPAPGSDQQTWTYHPEAFGRYTRGIMGGSVMAVYDVNGDGLNDVVTALDAHGWGLAWFEQKRDAKGNISFVEHMVMDDFSTKNAGGVTFSELHASTFADMNGDGIPDFVVGKRYFSHLDTNIDPNPRGAPVLYWYETVRDPHAPGGAKLVPHLIDNHSGVGSVILAADLKHDGAMDVVTATRFGTFIFWNKQHEKAPAHATAVSRSHRHRSSP